MGHVPFMTPKTTSFKSPGLASIRSGTISPVRCFSNPEERPDDRLVFAATASHPTLSLPKGKMEKGFAPPQTNSFKSPGLASNRSGKNLVSTRHTKQLPVSSPSPGDTSAGFTASPESRPFLSRRPRMTEGNRGPRLRMSQTWRVGDPVCRRPRTAEPVGERSKSGSATTSGAESVGERGESGTTASQH